MRLHSHAFPTLPLHWPGRTVAGEAVGWGWSGTGPPRWLRGRYRPEATMLCANYTFDAGRVRVALLAIFFVTSCSSGARVYEGDGQPRSSIHWFLPALIVEFDQFSLASPYDATYEIRRMPDPRGNDLLLGIAPIDPTPSGSGRPSWGGDHKLGVVTFVAVRNDGKVLLDCETPIADLSWRRWDHDSPFATKRVGPCPLILEGSTLGPDDRAMIRFSYRPLRTSPDIKAIVRMQSRYAGICG